MRKSHNISGVYMGEYWTIYVHICLSVNWHVCFPNVIKKEENNRIIFIEYSKNEENDKYCDISKSVNIVKFDNLKVLKNANIV